MTTLETDADNAGSTRGGGGRWPALALKLGLRPRCGQKSALMASCAASLLLHRSSPSLIRRRDPLPIEATELAGLPLALNASSNSSTSFATVLSRVALLKAVKTNSGCKLLRRQLPQLQMLLPNASAATSSGWRPSADPRDDGLVILSGRMLVLADGLVASLAPPLALFDLCGGMLPPYSRHLLERWQLQRQA